MGKTNYSGLNPVVVQALNNLQYRYSNETPEMWCSRVRYPFKTLLEYNPKYFSKNGFIQMIERSYIDGEFKPGRCSFHIYCTVCDSLVIIPENTIKCGNDHLNKCITKTAKMYYNPIRKNMKKGGRVALLSPDEIEKIYLAYAFKYSRGLNHYSYDSHECRKTVAYRLFNSAKLIQQTWRRYRMRPKSLASQIWEMVRNDGTPDDKKYLGMTSHVHYSLYDWAVEKKIQLWIRLCNETYKNVLKILYQRGYIIIRGSDWSNQLKWLQNPDYYRIDKDNIEYLIRVTECEKYKDNAWSIKSICERVGL
ncbi:hypothetical protein RclHR1_04650024 [Rhizophagus clarus]|uniref:Uncharacterized protein n=1 Tax=Rhizophagus clarus TaxID=94130 RepID=A0A2Z6RFF6_9GLOM|nr:hypothetical protein RclHR1_01840043 [Rhizophagus clarus]GBC02507.1 hypothetical protein RclHR1_04650024 [Rhizophagus clarus]